MNPGPLSSPHTVVYYDPFTHYAAADLIRATILCLSLVAAGTLLALAQHRWSVPQRRSASVFLVTLSLSLGVHAWASAITLGHPPTPWWLLWARLVVCIGTLIGSGIAVAETKRGMWRPLTET